MVFKEQEYTGLEVWQRDFTNLRFPKAFNIRADPFERGDESLLYGKWLAERMFLVVPAQTIVGQWLSRAFRHR